MDTNEISANNKRFLLLYLLVSFLYGAASELAYGSDGRVSGQEVDPVTIVYALVFNFLLFYWISVDALLHGLPFSRALRYSTVLFGAFTWAYYFVRTRRVRRFLWVAVLGGVLLWLLGWLTEVMGAGTISLTKAIATT